MALTTATFKKDETEYTLVIDDNIKLDTYFKAFEFIASEKKMLAGDTILLAQIDAKKSSPEILSIAGLRTQAAMFALSLLELYDVEVKKN